MFGLSNNEIPSVGKVELAWVQTPLPPVTLSNTNKTEDSIMDEGDAMMSASMPAHSDAKREQMENLDYDVADDNEWGIQ
jgi:hypothetical protein